MARHRAGPEPFDAASSSSDAVAILRRMSAGSAAAAMIRLVIQPLAAVRVMNAAVTANTTQAR